MLNACLDEGKEFFRTPPSTPPRSRRTTRTPTPEVVHIVAPESKELAVIPRREEYPTRVLIGTPEPKPVEEPKSEEPLRVFIAEQSPVPKEVPEAESPIMIVDEPKPKPKPKPKPRARRSHTQEITRMIEYTGENQPQVPHFEPHARNDRNEVERIVSPVMGKVRLAFGKDLPEDKEGKQPYLRGVGKLPVVPQPKRAVSASPVLARKRLKSPIPRPSSMTPPGTPLERPGNPTTRST